MGLNRKRWNRARCAVDWQVVLGAALASATIACVVDPPELPPAETLATGEADADLPDPDSGGAPGETDATSDVSATGTTFGETGSDGTAACTPSDKTCVQGCDQLYLCAVEVDDCALEERMTHEEFVADCVQVPECELGASLVNECDCAATIEAFASLDPGLCDSTGGATGTGTGG